MKNIYTSVDIGSDSIKMVTAQIIDDRINVLASVSMHSGGIKKGLIVDAGKALVSAKEALVKLEDMLGIKINKVIASVPCNNASFSLVSGTIELDNDSIINGNDIIKVLRKAMENKISEGYELINTIPIDFEVDGKKGIKDPKGISGNMLNVKAILVTAPNKNVYSVLSLLQNIGLNVVDICFNSMGDYEIIRSEKYDSDVTSIVNIGSETTTLSVFNKGILMNTKVLMMGSKNIDKDLNYMYKISLRASKKIKENFALAHKRFASNSERIDVINNEDKKIKLNQMEVSMVCSERLMDIIKIAKNELKSLTNKEISYIMITGGASEIKGLNTLLNEMGNRRINLMDINVMGARKNRFTASVGMIKYFHNKLAFRGRSYSMLDTQKEIELTTYTNNISKDSSSRKKFFGHFFDN